MATYAIGDIQGCYDTFQALLERIDFDPAEDRLWIAGDLVNRGPNSLGVLRLVKSFGDRAVAVLGNHDVHLLRRHYGLAEPKPHDTIDDVLTAPDAAELCEWLCHKPLVHAEAGHVMVHAGLKPQWSSRDALRHADEVTTQLKNAATRNDVLDKARAPDSLRVLTTVRACDAEGRICKFNGPPDQAPAGCRPWFSYEDRGSRDDTVVFGHWSALGILIKPNLIGLDSGCVWGRSLSAMRLEDRRLFQEPYRETEPPAVAKDS